MPFRGQLFGGKARIQRCLDAGGHFVGGTELVRPAPANRPAGKQKGEGYDSMVVIATCSNCGVKWQLPEGTAIIPLEKEDD